MTQGVILNLLLVIFLFGGDSLAQDKPKAGDKLHDSQPCDQFAPPVKQAMGQSIGVEQCHIVSEETVFNIKGHRYRRVEIRLSGTVQGWASREKGSRAAYFTDGPDFVFTQSGLTGPRSRGVARYEAATKHGMTILYPEDSRHWNGRSEERRVGKEC